MYAVVKTGGKQYRVAPGDILKVERLDGEAGATVTLDQVLLLAEGETVTLGTPLVADAVVTAQILEQTRAPKIIVFKKKRRHNYRRKRGHRQHVTVLKVLEIGRKTASQDKAETGGKAAKAKTKAGEKTTKKTPAKGAGKTAKARTASPEKAEKKATAGKAASKTGGTGSAAGKKAKSGKKAESKE
ncbi:MAG: 50S ribosomal protein L21 [Alphaproteobacteria bacterium]|nr:MAG: 50S ribosomal protein L21 [Alphaproteobacteria bacterium]